MKKQIFAVFILINLISNSVPLWAADKALSLEEVLEVAYWKHPSMMEARQEISASKGRWIQSEALPDPELELAVGGFKKNEDGVRDRKLDSVTIKQPLAPLGTRFFRGREGWHRIGIAKSELELTWGEIRVRIIELYARILAGQKGFEIARDNLNATRQFFTSVETRFQSGNARQSDVLRARIEVSKAENDLLINEKDLKVSRSEMNLALGRSIETPLALADSLDYQALQYRYESLLEKAVKDRADLKIEKKKLRIAKNSFWSALLRGVFPKMAIGVERTTEEFENDTALVLEASYPLWSFFNFGEMKEAKAEKEKQEVRLEALKRQVSLEVYQAFLEAELADKQTKLQKKALDEANELLRQVTLSYEEGDVPFLTYLENTKTIKETRLAYLNALKGFKEKVADLERIIQATPIPGGEK